MLGRRLLGRTHAVAFLGEVLAHLRVHGFVVRLPGGESVDIPVVHAEGCGDEDGVVDLEIRCAEAAGTIDVAGSDVPAALLDFSCDGEQGKDADGCD